jgi:hypothetical protein
MDIIRGKRCSTRKLTNYADLIAVLKHPFGWWNSLGCHQPGAVQLILKGASGGEYTVLTTTDISTPNANWTPLPNSAGIFGAIAVTNLDSAATNKARFYRIRSP